MIKKNYILLTIIIVSIFSLLIISENNNFVDEKLQMQNPYVYSDNITIDNISYRVGKKQNMDGVSKAVISAFNINNKFLWEYYNETSQNSQLRKITYLNGTIYAVGSEYNAKFGTEKLMILSLNASAGSLNWKYYNDSFKFSRLNTVAISQNIIYCGGYESNNALIVYLTLDGNLKGKYIINDSNISEIKNIEIKNNSLYCDAKTWNNENTILIINNEQN